VPARACYSGNIQHKAGKRIACGLESVNYAARPAKKSARPRTHAEMQGRPAESDVEGTGTDTDAA
jgi:hypothetical protein